MNGGCWLEASGNSYCAPACSSNAQCPPGAICFTVDGGARECYPGDQTCSFPANTSSTTGVGALSTSSATTTGPSTAGNTGTTGTTAGASTGGSSGGTTGACNCTALGCTDVGEICDSTSCSCVPNPNGGDGCSAAASESIYVIGAGNGLFSFNPNTTPPTFTSIGSISCAGLTPFSMSVDRSGTAWVLLENSTDSRGQIFNVSTTTAACTSTSFVPNQDGITGFGMGFVANPSSDGGAITDTLYIAGGNLGSGGQLSTSKLATLDTSTLVVSQVGTVSGEPELTGTGSGQLWGFFPGSHPTVSQIDQATGALTNTFQLPQLAGNPMAWAFAFYGGNFWIFLERTSDSSTVVWELNGQDGGVTKAIADTGKEIVGAGESTCVPVGPPTR